MWVQLPSPAPNWNEMSSDVILTNSEIEFLKEKFNTNDLDQIVEKLVEQMVFEGLDPMDMKAYVDKMMKRHLC